MKLTKNIFIFVGLGTSVLMYSFSYDSAIYAAQKGNWQDAYAALNNMIIHNPDSADIMYDAGIATYNLGNTGQAAACFTRAAECSSDKDIAVRAYFNAGNAYVGEKNLKGALEQYDKALAIESNNEYVRHNRDRVEEMLKQENQDQKKNNQDNKNQDKQDDQKDNQEDDQKNDHDNNQDKQQNQDGQNEEQNNKNDQSGDDKGSQQKNSEQKQQQKNNQSSSAKASEDKQQNQQSDNLDEQSQADQRDNATERSKETERKEHGNKEQQQKNSSNNQKRDGKDELNKQSHDAKSKGDKQQGDKHSRAPEKQNKINDKNTVPGQGTQEQAIDDPWLLTVLNNQEMHDKAVNKQLMQTKIRQHGGKNGQNCW